MMWCEAGVWPFVLQGNTFHQIADARRVMASGKPQIGDFSTFSSMELFSACCPNFFLPWQELHGAERPPTACCR